ncbi:MAG: hypothetical protein HYV68_00015 [Candidatus Taylorbacteria bacterium]|nr:hypothetical protein [Candidatus Taylorbacteria bacterium]
MYKGVEIEINIGWSKKISKIFRSFLVFSFILIWIFSPLADPFLISKVQVQKAEAAATQTGTDNNGTARATDVNTFAGSSWNATKSTAGTKTLKIDGTNIRVVSAWLEYSATMVTSANITDVELGLDVSPGPSAGNNVWLDTINRNGQGLTNTSGLSGPQIYVAANATSLFQSQTDADWSSGLAVVGVAAVTGPTRHLQTMKLVLTYEQDYSTIAHNETKTVRFPMGSTKTADCAVSATCSFTYDTANRLPDLASASDIYDVWFEITSEGDTTATVGQTVNFTPSINGGAAGTAHSALDPATALADHLSPFIIYRPSVATNNFDPLVTPSDTLDIVNGAGVALSALTVELVITYKFSTGASVQTETVRFYYGQDTTNRAAGAKVSFTGPNNSTTLAISNTGADVKNIWFKANGSAVATAQLQIFGDVDGGGATAETSTNANVTSANPRSGGTTVIHDMSSDAASVNDSAPVVTGAYQWNTAAGSVASAELYITFTWSGSSGGQVTKTVQFYGGLNGGSMNYGTSADGNEISTVINVALPETVTKTYRSAFLDIDLLHSEATSLTISTLTIGVNGSTTLAVPELADATSEAFNQRYRKEISPYQFAGGTDIGWPARTFNSTVEIATADEISGAARLVVTYDAAHETKPIFSSATNQTFEVGGSSAEISPITITDNAAPSITAANDIRIAIATSSVNMLWDTSVAAASLSGTAWNDDITSNSITYEGGGSVAVINAANNFEGSEMLVVSGLKFKNFSSANSAVSGLVIFTGGVNDISSDATDSKTVALYGTHSISDHSGLQISNKFNGASSYSGPLFKFRLVPAGESINIQSFGLNIDTSNIAANDITNSQIYADYDSDGIVDASDNAVFGSGSVSINNGGVGSIVFSSGLSTSTARDYIFSAAVSSIGSSDELSIQLKKNDITASGVTSGFEIQSKNLDGIVSANHFLAVVFAGGAPIEPRGQGAGLVNNPNVSIGGGEEIGAEDGFTAPTANGTGLTTPGNANNWTSPSNAYSSDNSYATAGTAVAQDYGNFGFNIPSGDSIVGVDVKVEGKGSTAAGTFSVALSWNGGTTYTTATSSWTLSTSDQVFVMATSSDLWGRASWSPSEFSDANFRLRITAAPSSNTVSVDAIQVRVQHQVTGGGEGGGGRSALPYAKNFAMVDEFFNSFQEKLSYLLKMVKFN